jgi:hypothetical protein
MENIPSYDTSRNQLPSDRRANKRMTDEGRLALGMTVQYPPEEKEQFVSEATLRIEKIIDNSELTKPLIKRKIEDMIMEALISNEISEPKAEALLYHLEETVVYQQNITATRDFREVQFKD